MRFGFVILSLILVTAACGGGGSNNSAPNGGVVAATTAPPALPEYDQPPCPAEGHIWTPGYWGYDIHVSDYYWVPGTWVAAPQVGLLWTPPYWSWNGAVFIYNEGWWGPQVGFYGGISYGFGYFGTGFQGGMWQGGQFFYNRMATNVDITVIRNIYSTNVVNANYVTRVSYNGGVGGIIARPTAEEVQARVSLARPTAEQLQHAEAARAEPQLRASANHGRPPVVATTQPGKFAGEGVVKGKEDEPVSRPTPRPVPETREKPAQPEAELVKPEPSKPAPAKPEPAKPQVNQPEKKPSTATTPEPVKSKDDDETKPTKRASPEAESRSR